MRKLITQAFWFVIVGCLAAATHWLIAVALVEGPALPPLVANFGGWMVAFCVSFSGHYRLTFRHQPKELATTLRRFFVVSCAGFLCNEVAYAYLLHSTPLRYDVRLALILLAIAVATFVVSRYWAFRGKH